MASRIRTLFRGAPRHRAEGPAVVESHPASFRPRHCAGTSCFHDHADDALPAWRDFHEAVS